MDDDDDDDNDSVEKAAGAHNTRRRPSLPFGKDSINPEKNQISGLADWARYSEDILSLCCQCVFVLALCCRRVPFVQYGPLCFLTNQNKVKSSILTEHLARRAGKEPRTGFSLSTGIRVTIQEHFVSRKC